MNTVYDWKYYCTEAVFCNVVLFDNDSGEVVFEGMLADVPDEYLDWDVQSFDPVDDVPCLTLNIGQ